MIQRIQTVFLALIAILHIILFFTPFYAGSSPSGTSLECNAAGMDCTGNLCAALTEFNNTPNAMQVSNIIIVMAALATIFLYNNRILQIKIARFVLLSAIVQAALMAVMGERIKSALENMPAL
ncbi:MAG: DUF4293 family protein [Sphingobacteriales bacterium]|nr:MAG: DUF4293 family protein [Sphingobacteriales bacterium]